MKNAVTTSVLIVEGDKDQRLLLESSLLKSNLDISVIASVEDADYAFPLSSTVSPDIIIVDVTQAQKAVVRFGSGLPTLYVVPGHYEAEIDVEENVIGILEKPLEERDIIKVMKRYLKIKQHLFEQFNARIFYYRNSLSEPKDRFVVHKGKENTIIKTEDIAYLYNENRLTFLVDVRGNKFFIDHPLIKIQTFLDPRRFFRVSRKYLINISAIKKFRSFEKAKIQLTIDPEPTEPIIVSSSLAADFRRWIGEEFV